MGGDLRLIEQDRLGRIDPAGHQCRDHFAGVAGELCRIVWLRQGMQVGQKDKALSARRDRLVLKLHIIDDCAKIIAEMGLTRGLNARDNAHDFN